MRDELVDIVDERDEVVGQMMKSQAHAGGLRHRLVAVYVFLGDKVLIQKRTPHKNGRLDHSVGGHVAQGERYQVAASREMQEELGISPSVSFVAKVFEDVIDPMTGHKFRHQFAVFEAHINDAEFAELKYDVYEAEEIILMTLEELAEMIRQDGEKFTAGIGYTLNAYIQAKNLPIKPVPIPQQKKLGHQVSK